MLQKLEKLLENKWFRIQASLKVNRKRAKICVNAVNVIQVSRKI